MEDYRTIKYTNCHLGLLKCEDCAFNCAFKGICKERFNYQCMANHQDEHLYGADDKNYHFVLYKNRIGYMGTTLDIFYPATKEQRDLLFTKMKECGFKWNFEKKTLESLYLDENDVY